MSDKNIEMMKKLIEAKQKKSSEQKGNGRPTKSMGGAKKAVRNKKTGGLFDK